MDTVNAFSPDAQNNTINLNGKDLPLVVADHSVVYLPMKDGVPIVCLNAADAWDKRKGINDTLKDFNNKEMKDLCRVDEDLMKKLIVLIKKECDNGEIISYKTPEKEQIFATDGWELKIKYNFIEPNPVAGAGAGAVLTSDNKILIKAANVVKVKEFIREMLELCQLAVIEANVKPNAPAITPEDIKKELNKAVKGFKDKQKRGYYIFQVPGSYINTQPFGGFNFSKGRDNIYNTSDAFKGYLDGIFHEFPAGKIFSNEVDNSGMVWACPPCNESGSLIHLDSKGAEIEDLVKHIKGFPETDIFAGDTNLTVGKGNITNRHDISSELLHNGLDFFVLMSKVQIQKSRAGGPFMNSQIYKSVPTPTDAEHDGMMILFRNVPEVINLIDFPKIFEMPDFELFYGGSRRETGSLVLNTNGTYMLRGELLGGPVSSINREAAVSRGILTAGTGIGLLAESMRQKKNTASASGSGAGVGAGAGAGVGNFGGGRRMRSRRSRRRSGRRTQKRNRSLRKRSLRKKRSLRRRRGRRGSRRM